MAANPGCETILDEISSQSTGAQSGSARSANAPDSHLNTGAQAVRIANMVVFRSTAASSVALGQH